MKKSQDFWQSLKNTNKTGKIYALAPLAGITDSAFRQICKEFGADVVYSEMASATALIYSPQKTLEMLKFDKKERPYVVQLFGSNPEHFAKATKLIEREIKPDGIDINFGCPVSKIAKQKAGAELFKDTKLSREIIKTVIANTNLPVSIKTRIKAGSVDILEFLDYVSDLDIKAIMIHGRTLKQGFNGPVDYKVIKETRKHFKGVILANGGVGLNLTPNPSPCLPVGKLATERGVRNYCDWLLDKTGADGIGIGRGALGKPWIFSEVKSLKSAKSKVSIYFCEREIFKVALQHAKLVYKLKGEVGIREMRKHLCWYVAGLSGAREMRQELVKVENLADIKKIFAKCKD